VTATLDWPRPVAVLNIGGVANVTSVDQNDDWVAFDTGPGSALLDDFMHAGTGEPWDEDGAAANLERPAMTVGNGAATLTMLTVETIGIARPFAPTAAAGCCRRGSAQSNAYGDAHRLLPTGWSWPVCWSGDRGASLRLFGHAQPAGSTHLSGNDRRRAADARQGVAQPWAGQATGRA